MNHVSPITPELLAQMEAGYAANPNLNVLSRALSSTKLTDAAFIPENAAKLRMDFSIEVPTTGVTNQKQSGRCWMFSAMNLVRERVIEKCHMKEFALSGTYLAFYDKLEKGNNFFEAVLHYADQPLDSRENASIFQNCNVDGGQWDMAVGLMKKYGVVPDWVMPETVHSSGTAEWKDVVMEKLREDGLELRRLYQEGKDTGARRAEMLQELYNALCILYGQPTKVFDFAYTDKEGKYHCHSNLTPKAFYEQYVGDDLENYIGIISAPSHEFDRTYSQPFMGDIVENEFSWLNLSMEETEALAIAQLKDGEGVVFSCDCHAYRDRAKGYWDQDSFAYGDVLGGLTLGMTKREKLLTGNATMNHCMMFCGVNLTEDGTPNRWKIENSWGDASGQKGYFICSEKWFREYVFQIIVRKSLLNDRQRALLAQEPIPMKFWDPLA